MKQMFKNTTGTSIKRRGFAALFAIVLIIALTGSTVYAADGAPKKAGYPDFKYTVKHNNRDNAELPDLSIEKAAEAGAKYIYDIYGEDVSGHKLWMSYMSARNQWAGRVTKSDSKLERGTIIFSFIIDAEHGKRIRMYDMRDSETEASLPEKSMTGKELSKFLATIPDNMEEYKKLASEFAQKHFYDDKVASLEYKGVSRGGIIVEIDPDGVYYYKVTRIIFVATDSTGREAEIVFDMDTGKLVEIRNPAVRGVRSGNR